MSPRERARLLPPAFAALLLLLLAALATLQYRWIGRVSALERQRMQETLLEDGSRFAEDVDRELARAFLYFHPEPARSIDEGIERAVRQLERWRADAPWPGLVKDVIAARFRDGGDDGDAQVAVLRPGSPRFAPVPWTPALAGIRRRLAERAAPGRPMFPWAAVDPEIPGLVLPPSFPPPGPPQETSADGGHAVLIVRFDERVLAGEVLPELTRRHFGSREGTDYALAVLDARGRAVFRSDATVPLAAFRNADLRLDMMRLRPFHDMRGLMIRREPGEQHGHDRQPAPGPNLRLFGPEMPGTGAWHLAIHHREGSLEAAVTAARHHNLAVSLGILTLLAATMGLMMITTQRAQRLARQQIEFVAGVTHELHTPLTAIRSAGQNLADGVVSDPQQVRRYGALVEREGRRLTDMVGQALELAGIQSGRRIYHARPEEVAELVDGALEDCRGLLDQRQVRVEREIPEDLPPVLADGAALRRALRNLIENAVRHGRAAGEGSWVGLRARSAPDGIEITVSDRGPGIRREDLPHLFEPFYRGRDASANGVPGSGLGLSVVRSVVEALGGRVSVAADGSGPGSAFTLHLPAAPREERLA